MLTPSEIVLIAILIGTFALLLSGKTRPDVTAILVLLALATTGLVTPQEALSGFSRGAVITIIGLFIITHALETTGLVQTLANHIRRVGRGSEVRLVILFMAAGALLSMVMNNIAAAAVLLPAAVQVGRDSGVRLSKLLMPLSFGTMVGGMATYFTTANIIMSGVLHDQNLPGLDMMDFLPTGGLIVLLALAYMALIGRRLLPEREPIGTTTTPRSLSRNLFETYSLDERLWDVHVPAGSKLVNTALSHSHIGAELGLTVLAIKRGGHTILTPEPITVINSGDTLLVLGRWDRVEKLAAWGLNIEPENGGKQREFAVDLTEVIIPPRSGMIGKTLRDIQFRSKFGLTSVALWREGRSYRTDVGSTPLAVGDALLMVGAAARVKALAQDSDYLVLQSSHQFQPPNLHKARWALLIMLVVLAASIVEVLPLPQIMLAGAAAVVLTGCLNMDEAYRAVEWRVVFLIAGMIPLSVAMVNTGLGARLGTLVTTTFGNGGSVGLILGFWALATAITQIVAGQITPLMIGPIAIASAITMGVNPQAMAVAVAIGASTAFLTPLSHAVNILMMGPGGYTFGDFTRVGVGMTLVTLIGLVIGLMLFWGIR